MKLYPQSICPLALLSLCCVLITVRESYSTFVPGRCLCPEKQIGVRGRLKDLRVLPKITLQRNNAPVCLDPEGPMAKQLIRCWERVQKLGRDVKLCLKRKRVRGGQRKRTRQRRRGHNRKASSQDSQ
uniref:Chemokine interleukin-8-like domain-containing protein n=1 Tax=Amphilophus citrinellus TaxID=61819 RepID=A0A3Q0T6V5_AMPCI